MSFLTMHLPIKFSIYNTYTVRNAIIEYKQQNNQTVFGCKNIFIWNLGFVHNVILFICVKYKWFAFHRWNYHSLKTGFHAVLSCFFFISPVILIWLLYVVYWRMLFIYIYIKNVICFVYLIESLLFSNFKSAEILDKMS